MNYNEQLKDKRWIALSNHIKRRDKVCQMCGEEKDLQVHHTYYDKFLMAWEYDDMYLITLCKECHKRETGDLRSIQEWISEALKSGMFAQEIKNKINAKI